jgi:hypothetical protein
VLAAVGERPSPATPSAGLHLRPSTRDDLPALSVFLQRMFQLPPSSASLDPQHIAWKYWADREDWNGPRSFTARHGQSIVAHVAAWPVRVRLRDRVLQGAHLIDWASDPRYPGAGIWLLRQVRARTAVLIATGGTAATQRTLPLLGFRRLGELSCFARPLRPLAQMCATEGRTLRSSGRFVRNAMWRVYAPVSRPSGWSAAAMAPEDIDESVWPAASDTMGVASRDAAFYRYLLASPVTRHVLYGLRHHGALAGFFCVAYARHVARIADLWVTSAAAGDWCAGFRTASAVAAQSKDVHEVTAWTSTAIGRQALTRAGFRLRDSAPLSAAGDVDAIGCRDVHIQMLECDASFLRADEVCYLT